MSLREALRAGLAERAAGRGDRPVWPPSVDTLLAEDRALNASAERGDEVDEPRAHAVARQLAAYIASLPAAQQQRVARMLVNAINADENEVLS